MSTGDSADRSRGARVTSSIPAAGGFDCAAARPRSGRAHRFLAGALAASLLAPVALIAASGLGSTPALAAGPEITGAGSSYAAVAIQNWVAQVASVYGINVNYSVSTSVIGLNLFAQNQVNFGASEIGYSTGQMSYSPTEPYQYLPDVAGATCLMYNVKGRLGNQLTSLNLSNQVLAEIWTGTITNWDAPQIAAINKNVLLPNAPIVGVFRTDASGENYLFSQYLDYIEPKIWQPFVQTLQAGAYVSANWPSGTRHGNYHLQNFVGQAGSDVASDFVAATNDSMTYVETAYALLHHDPCAYIQNASGNWVAPSEETDAVGLERAQLLPDLEQKLQGVYSNPLPSAYPISAYSYLVTPKVPGSISSSKGAVLGEFIRFFACTGQNSAGVLGYSPLPPNLVDADFAAINRIPGAARAPTTATAANCSDPYVNGQTPLPGEPCIGSQCSNSGGGTTTPPTPPTLAGSTPGTTTPGQATTPVNNGKSGKPGSRKKSGSSQTHYGGPPSSNSSPSKSGNLSVADGLWPGQKIIPGAQTGGSLKNGQTLGNELATEDFSLIGVRVSDLTMWASVVLLLLLVAVPPTIARSRRRRRLQTADQPSALGRTS
jgi:phosphate transport system substrate-binding protein